MDAQNAPTRDLETTKQFPQRQQRSSSVGKRPQSKEKRARSVNPVLTFHRRKMARHLGRVSQLAHPCGIVLQLAAFQPKAVSDLPVYRPCLSRARRIRSIPSAVFGPVLRPPWSRHRPLGRAGHRGRRAAETGRASAQLGSVLVSHLTRSFTSLCANDDVEISVRQCRDGRIREASKAPRSDYRLAHDVRPFDRFGVK